MKSTTDPKISELVEPSGRTTLVLQVGSNEDNCSRENSTSDVRRRKCSGIDSGVVFIRRKINKGIVRRIVSY